MGYRQNTTVLDVRQRLTLKKSKRSPFCAILDNIRSLYNVGAMFRTADGVLLEKLFLCGITGRPPRREIEKTALGATSTVPWEYFEDTAKCVKKLKKSGVSIVGLEIIEKSRPYFEKHFEFPSCLVVGNEITGISSEILSLCDDVVYIPMLGQKESLNCATAFGIVMYEMLRQCSFY